MAAAHTSDRSPHAHRQPVALVIGGAPEAPEDVSQVLGACGFRPRHYATSNDLNAALDDVTPQVIVLNLALPDADATEVIRILSGRRFTGDVVLIGGDDAAALDALQSMAERRGVNMLEPLRQPQRLAHLHDRMTALYRAGAAPEDASLAAALRNNWLELWYQPKFDLRAGRLGGAEASVRLRHPTHGIVPPSRFLPAPGDALYAPLTDFVVEQALVDWAQFAAHDMSGPLAINVPASVLQQPEFVSHLYRFLPADPGFPGLIVEITEDEAIADPEVARAVALQLRLHNVMVSIDDFGSGYSSLERLEELPFAEIKLDRSYVNGCARDAGKRAMCRSVVDLARRFHIEAVAEGVESEEDLRVLVEAGYDMVQGYLFARPMQRAEFIALLSSGSGRSGGYD